MKNIILAVVALIFAATLAIADDSIAITKKPAPAGTTVISPIKKAGEVGKRQKAQLKRIKKGAKSGALTKKETKGFVSDEKTIQSEKKDMKEENGGILTNEDKKDLNKDLNKESKKIYKEKQNEAVK
jgi:hypothetical protein